MTNAFAADSTRCFLLRKRQHAGGYESILEVTSGFFSEWSSYREQTRFSFATTDSAFENSFARATHIAYGAGSSLDVFAIAEDQRDKIFPDGTSPEFKAFGTRVTNERFEP
jgi:hypothetical protein